MAQTYLNMQDEILDRLKDKSSGMRTRVKRWINLARHEIASLSTWWFMVKKASTQLATVASTREYSLATDVDQLVQVRHGTTFAKLDFVNEKDIDAVLRFGETDLTSGTGTPSHFTLLGFRKIQLFKTPNAVINYDYWYKKVLADLSLDADASDFLETFEPLIMWRAEWYGRRFQGDQQRLDEARQEFWTLAAALAVQNRSKLEFEMGVIIPESYIEQRVAAEVDVRGLRVRA